MTVFLNSFASEHIWSQYEDSLEFGLITMLVVRYICLTSLLFPKYYDLNDNEQMTLLIRGSTVAPDEVYTDTNGVIYTRLGNDIEIDVSNYNNVDIFKILPNWNIGDINKITIKTNKRVMLKMNKSSLHDKSGTIVNHSNSVWRVENPESTVFKWLDSYWTHLAIKDLINDFGRDVSPGDSREPYFIYTADSHEYVTSDNEGV